MIDVHQISLVSISQDLSVKEAGTESSKAMSPRQFMGTMAKGVSTLERTHGPVIVISEQETLVFAGGARLRALEGVSVSWLCTAPPALLTRVPKPPLCFCGSPLALEM